MKKEDIVTLINNLSKRIAKIQPMLVAPYIPNFKITIMLEPKYKFSRAKWYQANFDTINYHEVEQWCTEQFGPHPKQPDAWSRWWHKFEDSILFRDEQDYFLFVLKWGRHE